MWKFYFEGKEQKVEQPQARRLTRKMTREIIESIDNSLKKREAGLRKTLSPDSHMARLMSIKMMLMKAKKRREDAASEQKLKLDPLLNSQPSFFFSYKKAGNEKQDRANFSSYLSGELTLSDFIQIQNFERLYNQIKPETLIGKSGNKIVIGEEKGSSVATTLQKLKHRILEKQRFQKKNEEKQNVLELLDSQELKSKEKHEEETRPDPKQHLATKIRECIISKHSKSVLTAYQQKKLQIVRWWFQFCISNKSLQKVKLMQELNSINEAFVQKIENKDLICRNFGSQYYTKESPKYVMGSALGILKSKREPVEVLPKNRSMKQLRREFTHQLKCKAASYLSSQQHFDGAQESAKSKQTSGATTREGQRQKQSYLQPQSRVEEQVTMADWIEGGARRRKEVVTRKGVKKSQGKKARMSDKGNLLHSANCSCDSSFQSLFEIGIDDFYTQTLQLENQILKKKSEAFVKRIKQLQKINELSEQVITANCKKLASRE